MRLLFVVPRYGPEIVGGAERLAQLLASRAVDEGDEAVIATTCAVDHHDWGNDVAPGISIEDGIIVHRFTIAPRNAGRYAELHARLISDRELSYLDELEFMANSVWSPDLQSFLEREGCNFDLLLFVPYLLGTTFWGMQVWPERSVLIPCLHDEPYAHMTCIRDMIETSAGCIFNTPAEERLAESLFALPPSGVVGLGFDLPSAPAPPGFSARHGLGRFVVYVGRLEEGKGVHEIADFVARYARSRASDLRLVLVGAGSYEPPPNVAKFVLNVGWLSEDEKRSALAESIALVHPSRLESLSIVLMEAWLEGTPAIVSSNSDVLREHCERSGGGLTYSRYSDFRERLDRLLGDVDLRRSMGSAGRRYVQETASWAVVKGRFRSVIEAIMSERGHSGNT